MKQIMYVDDYSVYRMERVTSKWPISELRGSFSILLNIWAFQWRSIFCVIFFLQNVHFEKSYDDFNFYVCELRCRPDWKNTFAKYIFRKSIFSIGPASQFTHIKIKIIITFFKMNILQKKNYTKNRSSLKSSNIQ